MPLEIRELHIKAIVKNPSDTASGSTDPSSEGGNEQLIKACVEKVLELLKETKER